MSNEKTIKFEVMFENVIDRRSKAVGSRQISVSLDAATEDGRSKLPNKNDEAPRRTNALMRENLVNALKTAMSELDHVGYDLSMHTHATIATIASQA